MHYRIPFYERLSSDNDFDFKLLYGRGKKGTKLINAVFDANKISAEQLNDIRMPLPFTPKLFFKLIRERPDIILSEGSSSLINGLIGFIYAKLFNKKFIWWSLGKLEGKEYSGVRKFISKIEKFIELKSDAIFTYSNFGKNYFISRGIIPERIFVSVNVLNSKEKLKELEHLPPINFEYCDYFNIGFIGTITKYKKLDILFDAVNDLNKKYNDKFRVHLIGDGPYKKQLQSYFKNKSIVDHGRINNGPGRILRNCDLLVLPGLGGLAICEGMISKLPIITGKADGTEYDLVNAENGFIASEMNREFLIDKIEYLYLNPSVRKKMSSASFERITKDLTFDRYYEGFKNLFNFLRKEQNA